MATYKCDHADGCTEQVTFFGWQGNKLIATSCEFHSNLLDSDSRLNGIDNWTQSDVLNSVIIECHDVDI